MRDWLLRFGIYILGIIILSFSVSLIIKADLGAGAWDALNVGLSKTVGFTVGTWVFIIGFILIFLNAWIAKERPMFTAIATIILIGIAIDFWLINALASWNPNDLVARIAVFGFALFFLAFGVALYLQSEFPINPIDHLMVVLHVRFNLSITVTKTIAEVAALVLAYIFNGPIGIGTIVITILIGPIIGFFNPILKSLLQRMRTQILA
ncbi:YczE/YyaS/YitT family protein [Bacillus solimangrovi]|uniref:Permease n=1 Tax=Bacillus solimangrovi TaxID=1305675 RepID=A0A1E5LB74_9BACI|nr:hypothetical protein [Bacillus solimangrovi]OEH91335.1 hypothetical protein BFG57_05575 [Bacillus solimangrovi]